MKVFITYCLGCVCTCVRMGVGMSVHARMGVCTGVCMGVRAQGVFVHACVRVCAEK